MFGRKRKKDKGKNTLFELEEKGRKSKLDIASESQEKRLRPATIQAMKAARIILYMFLVIILVAGVFQIITSKRPKVIKNIVEYNFGESESASAQTFAVAFTKEYLTYSQFDQEYNKRILPFIADSLMGGINLLDASGNSKVTDAMVWRVDKLNKQHSNIVVRAELEITGNENSGKSAQVQDQAGQAQGIQGTDITAAEVNPTVMPGGDPNAKKALKKVVYLAVPVGYYNGGYLVEDYPTFIETPSKPEAEVETFAAEGKLLEQDLEEIREVLDNFFRTYATGNEGQISYYMADNRKVKGYEGSFLYEDIKTIEAFRTEENEAIVVVQVEVKDSTLNTRFIQRYMIDVIKKKVENANDQGKESWYIKDFKVRGNMYKEEESK